MASFTVSFTAFVLILYCINPRSVVTASPGEVAASEWPSDRKVNHLWHLLFQGPMASAGQASVYIQGIGSAVLVFISTAARLAPTWIFVPVSTSILYEYELHRYVQTISVLLHCNWPPLDAQFNHREDNIFDIKVCTHNLAWCLFSIEFTLFSPIIVWVAYLFIGVIYVYSISMLCTLFSCFHVLSCSANWQYSIFLYMLSLYCIVLCAYCCHSYQYWCLLFVLLLLCTCCIILFLCIVLFSCMYCMCTCFTLGTGGVHFISTGTGQK